MAKKTAAKTARKGKSKTRVKRAARPVAAKPKDAPRRKAAPQGIAARVGRVVTVVVTTVKEAAELRRKMHADQRRPPEE